MPVTREHGEEFNRLLDEHGFAVRSMQYGYEPEGDALAIIETRDHRLRELAGLFGPDVLEGREPSQYVWDRTEAWVQAHPLALTTQRVQQIIEGPPRPPHVSTPVRMVSIQIGTPGDGGYYYQCMADDVTVENGALRFKVPESVAEQFRQQGKRQLTRQFASLLGLKSYL